MSSYRSSSSYRSFDRNTDNENDPGRTIAPPTACPACRSSRLSTTSKVVTAYSYWRCDACGEVWNAGRLATGRRYA